MNNLFRYYVQSFFKDYLPITRNLSQETIKTYSYGMLLFISFLKEEGIYIDNSEINDITIDLMEKFIKHLKEKRKNKPQTINNRISIIKSFFNYVELKSLKNFDICNKIKNLEYLKCEREIPKRLTVDEIQNMLTSIDASTKKGIKALAMITLLYDAGLRVSELCNLTINDLKLDNSQPTIFVTKAKGNKERIVPISYNTRDILKMYINQYNLSNKDFLFTNKFSNKYTRKGITYHLNKNCYLLAKGKTEDKTMYVYNTINPHMLRHSKASHMVESDINLILIRDFLGHEHVATTEIYARIGSKKRDELISESSKTIPLQNKKSKSEKENLEQWLRKNCINDN